MSKYKSRNNSQIVVGGAQQNPEKLKRLNLKGRSGVIALLIVVISIVLIVIGGWFAASHFMNSGGETKTKTEKKVAANNRKAPPPTTEQKSLGLAQKGDYDAAQKLMKDKLKDAKNDNDKLTSYLYLASNALNAKKYDEAEQYAKKAYDIKETDSTDYLLGLIYFNKGDKSNASTYFQKAIDKLDKSNVDHETQLKTYQEGLKASQ